MSVFLKGPRFAESDHAVTVTVPQLVIEVLSTPDRQQGVELRVAQYQTWGVPAVWLINQKTKTIQLFEERGSRNLDAEMMLEDIALLPSFRVPVIELFTIPDWAR
ncbi:MAG: Uma2 family endonuclease [Planctomycetota bacterium]|nr:MAG: Uma2 family endonuclease [Planctomycetota bacterium]